MGGKYNMTDTKKQIVVIAVLVFLIGTVGVLARNFSKGAANKPGGIAVKTNTTKSDTTNYFTEGRLGRDNQISAMKKSYEDIISNKDSTKESKTEATNKKIALMERSDKESQIETMVKGKGYQDALCFIDDKGVELCVKSKDTLTTEEVNQLKDIVVRTSSVSPTEIYIKQKD